MKIKIKKIHKDAVIPSYSKFGDAGLDLTCVEINENSNYIEYEIGISLEIPYGYVGLLFPRSSISNTGLIFCNSVGVIDSGYRGPFNIRCKYLGYGDKYKIGDRVGQLLIVPYPEIEFEEADILSDSERGSSGYGSTNIELN